MSGRLVRQHRLPDGAIVSGKVERRSKGMALLDVRDINGLASEQFQRRTPYTRLVAIDPMERFDLARSGDPTMRVMDLFAPIGKGTRGLIISPPKAGKTTVLEKIAGAIRAESPETRLIALLVDERPEEVTHFRRSVDAEVFASTNDRTPRDHIGLVEWTLAHVQIELECDRDVVVLIDSLTRIGRAFNSQGRGSGRTLSGGLEAGVLEVPRRLFGLARNVEDGGSVTIIATALTQTGSRMDQLILEEFKGTGNTEILLDRVLAEARIFPAIDLSGSGTRREENLLDEEHLETIVRLRRHLSNRAPKQAMEALLTLIDKYPDNDELLASIPPAM